MSNLPIALDETGKPVATLGVVLLNPDGSMTSARSSTPVTGTAATTGTVGPFTPQLGRAIWVTLSGTWSGTVTVLRSTDGGTTKLPLTYPDGSARGSWTGPVNAPVAEETVAVATYYLSVTLASGSVGYRVEQ